MSVHQAKAAGYHLQQAASPGMEGKERASIHCFSFILSNPALRAESGQEEQIEAGYRACRSNSFFSFVRSLNARSKFLVVPPQGPSISVLFPAPAPLFLVNIPSSYSFLHPSFSGYILSVPLSPCPQISALETTGLQGPCCGPQALSCSLQICPSCLFIYFLNIFFKKIFIYLAAPGLSCSTRDLHCGV